jgi:hypothetical protein
MTRREEVKTRIKTLDLRMPLTVAVQDLEEDIDERIEANTGWKIQSDVLMAAAKSGNAHTISKEIAALAELLEAYGPQGNPLKRAADDLEEQLRLRWAEEEPPQKKKSGGKK